MSAAPYITEVEVFGGPRRHWHEDRDQRRWDHEHALPLDISHRHRSFPPQPVPEYPSMDRHDGGLLMPVLLWTLLQLVAAFGIGALIGWVLLRAWDRLR